MSALTSATTVQTSSGPVTIRHRPEMAVSTLNGAAWITCTLCDRSDYAHRFSGKSHKSYCDLRGFDGFSTKPAPRAAAPTGPMAPEELKAAGEGAARDGMVTKRFRSEGDVVAAVANGYLSESAAMNRDD